MFAWITVWLYVKWTIYRLSTCLFITKYEHNKGSEHAKEVTTQSYICKEQEKPWPLAQSKPLLKAIKVCLDEIMQEWANELGGIEGNHLKKDLLTKHSFSFSSSPADTHSNIMGLNPFQRPALSAMELEQRQKMEKRFAAKKKLIIAARRPLCNSLHICQTWVFHLRLEFCKSWASTKSDYSRFQKRALIQWILFTCENSVDKRRKIGPWGKSSLKVKSTIITDLKWNQTWPANLSKETFQNRSSSRI